MTNAYQGPIPTRLITLSRLHNVCVGEKVRFLGCVTKYDISLATLTLEHKYPVGSNPKALVDVKLLLETLESTEVRVGEWVNVMGYVLEPHSEEYRRIETLKKTPFIQAIALWSAGSIHIEEYENTLNDLLLENQ